jgi:glycine cleavage system H protein
VNTKLKDDPKLVNSEPYSDGWLIKIEILSKEESSQLLSANAYAHETGN